MAPRMQRHSWGFFDYRSRDAKVIRRMLTMLKTFLLFSICIACQQGDEAQSDRITMKGFTNRQLGMVILEGENEATRVKLAAMEPSVREACLQVFVVSKNGADLAKDAQPIFGKYDWADGKLTFTSRYPAAPGVTYRAIVRFPGKESTSSMEITVPELNKEPTTKITTIYPTADVLPENLLKFYVHFSAPMSTGEAYKHIALETASGKKIELPFLEIAEELWDKTNTRLTLLLDPGRIKRGLVPREEEGPILVADQAYRFRVMKDWPDAEGAPLVSEVVKEFKVGPVDTTQPAPLEWKVVAPRSGGKDPIVIDLLEPLDHAIVARGIRVFNDKGDIVEGEVALARQEREWRFTPTDPWKAGDYELRIDDVIEDLVGNNITRPFELDRFDEVKSPEEKKVKLRLSIK